MKHHSHELMSPFKAGSAVYCCSCVGVVCTRQCGRGLARKSNHFLYFICNGKTATFFWPIVVSEGSGSSGPGFHTHIRDNQEICCERRDSCKIQSGVSSMCKRPGNHCLLVCILIGTCPRSLTDSRKEARARSRLVAQSGYPI